MFGQEFKFCQFVIYELYFVFLYPSNMITVYD